MPTSVHCKKTLSLLLVWSVLGARVHAEPPVLQSQFLYETAPFPACHAATVCETPGGLLAAFFAGTDEGENDVGIWTCRRQEGRWQSPVLAAEGLEFGSRRLPCWNPVLVPLPDQRLLLFYKVGPSPQSWWGMFKESADGGVSWTAPRRLPEGILGPVRNKPLWLGSRLLCGSSTEHAGWRVHLEWTDDLGQTWSRTPALHTTERWGLIQPTLFKHSGDRVQILCRSQQGRIVQLWSSDRGATWTAPEPIDLPNPNSGIDGVTLADGRHLLVYNHTERGRSPLNVALSDDGQIWKQVWTLEQEPGEFSYPAVIQTQSGTVEILYTWNRRRIRHVTLEAARLTLP
ncbi:MAG: exo-alpha-sialidase [Planctomycetaceae bacterium]